MCSRGELSAESCWRPPRLPSPSAPAEGHSVRMPLAAGQYQYPISRPHRALNGESGTRMVANHQYFQWKRSIKNKRKKISRTGEGGWVRYHSESRLLLELFPDDLSPSQDTWYTKQTPIDPSEFLQHHPDTVTAAASFSLKMDLSRTCGN